MSRGVTALQRVLVGLLLWTACAKSAPLSVEYAVTALGGNNYRYTYTVTGGDFLLNQALELQFAATDFLFLGPAAAPNSDWDGLVLQPNNPVGADGVWSLLALVDHPGLAGLFTIDFQWTGAGAPSLQHYFVNQYDEFGGFVAQVSEGDTVPFVPTGPTAVPEPSSAAMFGAGGVLAATYLGLQRRRQRSQAEADH